MGGGRAKDEDLKTQPVEVVCTLKVKGKNECTYRIHPVQLLLDSGLRTMSGTGVIVYTAEKVAELVTAHDAAPDHASPTKNLFLVGQAFCWVLAMLAILAALVCVKGPILQRCLL